MLSAIATYNTFADAPSQSDLQATTPQQSPIHGTRIFNSDNAATKVCQANYLLCGYAFPAEDYSPYHDLIDGHTAQNVDALVDVGRNAHVVEVDTDTKLLRLSRDAISAIDIEMLASTDRRP